MLRVLALCPENRPREIGTAIVTQADRYRLQ